MTGSEFLAQLQKLGVQLWAEGDAVRYRAPKDVLTEMLHAEMARRKAEILELLRESNRPKGVSFTTVQQGSRRGGLPLSFSQERLWFIDQLEPDNPAYNIPCAVRARGPLHVTALEQTFNEIVRRHEIFRTTCSTVNDRPVQVICPTLIVPLRVVDLRHIGEVEKEATVRRLAAMDAREPFDLARGPFLRISLLQLAPDDHVLLLTMHHFVADGWSSGVFFQELSTLYEAFSAGKSSPLPDLVIQYADFAQWQRRCLQGDNLESQIAYWKKQLAGAPAVVELPADRPRPPIQTYRGAAESLVLPRNLSEALKQLSRRQSATLFMTLLAAFQTLLYRYTGQNDIIVGTAVSNRNRTEVEGLIGPFANDLILRSDLSGNPTFRLLLDRVREVAAGAYAHQDLPFEKLVEELQPKRNLAHHPLFQIMFILHQQDLEQSLRLPDLGLSPVPIEMGTARYDLFLNMADGQQLSGSLEYSTDLFEVDTIKRMLGHFEALLESIVADPEQRVSALSMLSEAEREQLLVGWNATQAEYPECCVQELFEAQAERTPDAVAVVGEAERLSYRDLDDRAERLADQLRAIGVRPDVLVGICLERSVDLVVGLLGILKAGGAYVPIDPNYPAERIEYMMEDSAMKLLLTQERLVGNLPQSRCRVVSLEQLTAERELHRSEVAQESARAENLAYVIYTSGSTGRPKGVEIQHKALVNFLHSMRQRPGLTPQDVLLSVTTISFDIAGLELFLPLIVGACVVIASREVALDGRRLMEQLENCGATVMQATPATWRMLIDVGWSGRKDLKILCGGEALSGELASQLLERGASLWNLYGPTESTIWSTHYRVERVDGAVPIGRPIANTEIYILDRYLKPVPVGVPGELHIGGSGLARGYLNRAELTEKKFIRDPFSTEPSARLYKTGDLARYLSDGNIEYLGRLDHQVKIRGFRIELGEIESVLSQHQAVREAVVMVREDEPGDRRLVAYLVPKQDSIPTVSKLRNLLKSKLPDYMMPSAFVELDAFPLTPNGKVDRKALPVPDHDRSQSEKEYVAPRTPVEEVVAGIWADVLKLDQVNVHDDFFDLGGHSLLATQVISRLRNSLKVDLPLRLLFEQPTVAGLAEQIDTLLWVGERSRPSVSDKSENREEIKL